MQENQAPSKLSGIGVHLHRTSRGTFVVRSVVLAPKSHHWTSGDKLPCSLHPMSRGVQPGSVADTSGNVRMGDILLAIGMHCDDGNASHGYSVIVQGRRSDSEDKREPGEM